MTNPSRLRTSSTAAYLIAVGFVSILGQVVILRELNVAFYGIELIYILALGFWLLGTAIGAAVGRSTHEPQERSVQNLFLLTSAALASDIVLVRGIRQIFGGVPGGFLPFQTQLTGLMLTVLPLSFLTGLLFRWTARRFLSEDRTLAEAYSLESAGGVLGGLTSTLLLTWGFQNLSAGLLCCACSLAVVASYSRNARFVLQKSLSFTGLAVVLVLASFSFQLDRLMTSWSHPQLIESRDTPYGRITVTSREGQICIFENDALSYETQTTAAEEFVQLSALQSTNLERVLVLGGGFGGIIFELLKLPVRDIDYVEINKRAIEMVRYRLPPEFGDSFNDARIRIIYDDPRRFLEQPRTYDVILVAMPEPMSAQNNRFYTEEFFGECSKTLRHGGIFAFAIRSAENLWTPELRNRNRSIYAALKSAFENVVVIPGVTNIFIASRSALTTDPGILIERFRERKPAARLVLPEYINYVYTNDRFGEVNETLSGGIPVLNSDIQPACYSYTISIWLSKFIRGFTLPEPRSFTLSALLSSPVFWLIVTGTFIIALSKTLVTIREFLLMFLAGAVGMISETVLLLNYQSRSGVLYQDIGILLMTFMVGLTVGAFVTNKLITNRRSIGRKHRWAGAALILGFAVLNLVIYYTVGSGYLGSLLLTSLMLALVGAAVSAVFVYISLAGDGSGRKAMTWLYSADLFGGSAGSLIAILIFIPVFGILTTSVLAAVMAACALPFLK